MASNSNDYELPAIIHRFWYGIDRRRPTYHIATAIFLRVLGGIYLIAFVSLWTQVSGLVGDDGILPVEDYLTSASHFFATKQPHTSVVWNIPTLLWLSPHDGMLHFLCAIGSVLSLLLIVGFAPLLVLILLWVSYLSLFHGGQVFLGFQWDILLLEAGFVAIFVAPSTWRSKLFADPHPPRLAIWLVWWLLFRLMLESGAVKLTWNDWAFGPDDSVMPNTWESLTALNYHYWTQPLPTWISWYVAKLPEWFQKLSVVITLGIELILPWFIFGPRVLRMIACGGIILLMIFISATGNYTFFNLLTVGLALTLLDDRAWPQFFQQRISVDEELGSQRRIVRNLFLVPFACFAILVGIMQVKEAALPREHPQARLPSRLGISQFLLVNDYGLFRQMTQTRPEIVIEGSDDAVAWKPYEFRWKPGDPSRRPRFNAPHQPRLDWQMWFEALKWERIKKITGSVNPGYMSPWFQSFIEQLLHGNRQVVGLLTATPKLGDRADQPPKYIRAVLYQYRFTDKAEGWATGEWWHREQVLTGPAWTLPR